jgi:hypothetical protein
MTPNLASLRIDFYSGLDLETAQELPFLPQLKQVSLKMVEHILPNLQDIAPNVTDFYVRVTCCPIDYERFAVPEVLCLRQYANNLEEINIDIRCEYYAREFAALQFPNLKVLRLICSHEWFYPWTTRDERNRLKINLMGYTSLKKAYLCLSDFALEEEQTWESLEELEIGDVMEMRSIKMPALRQLTLKREGFSKVKEYANSCPNIVELRLEKREMLNPEEHAVIKGLFSNLKKIAYF